MNFGKLPIEPRPANVPVIALERWRQAGSALFKTYNFRRPTDRDQFVMQLLAYESSIGHHAEIHITVDQISLKVQTHDLGKITELDKEYAKYADVLFKGLVYNSSDEVP